MPSNLIIYRYFCFCYKTSFFSETDLENVLPVTTTTKNKSKKATKENRYNKSYTEYSIKEDKNFAKFSALDDYASHVPLELSQTIEGLANYLIQQAKTEEEKACLYNYYHFYCCSCFLWIIYGLIKDLEMKSDLNKY